MEQRSARQWLKFLNRILECLIGKFLCHSIQSPVAPVSELPNYPGCQRLFLRGFRFQGWRMVHQKLRVSQNFIRISRVSQSVFFSDYVRLAVSIFCKAFKHFKVSVSQFRESKFIGLAKKNARLAVSQSPAFTISHPWFRSSLYFWPARTAPTKGRVRWTATISGIWKSRLVRCLFTDKDDLRQDLSFVACVASVLDCEQSLFCSKIRGEKDAEHESRASSEAASSARGGRLARLPPRALLAASPLARDSCSATFSPRIFEQKRDCSQSTSVSVSFFAVWPRGNNWDEEAKVFCSRPISRASKTTKIVFFSEERHGNACYAGYLFWGHILRSVISRSYKFLRQKWNKKWS